MKTKRDDLATRRKVMFRDLADPRRGPRDNPFWPHSGEIAMGVYQWLIAAACARSVGRTGERRLKYPGAFEALTGASYHHAPYDDGSVVIDPREWVEHLRQRFIAALHGSDAPLLPVLRSLRVGLDSCRVVPVPHRVRRYGSIVEPDRHLSGRVAALYDYTGRITQRSYNDTHPNANVVSDVDILVGEGGYALDVMYGYPGQGSSWGIPVGGRKPYKNKNGRVVGWNGGPVVRSKPGESFLDFVDRCHALMQSIVVPSPEDLWNTYEIAEDEPGASRRTLGYVLAPSSGHAVDYWHEKHGAGKPRGSFRAVNVSGPCASFPVGDTSRMCSIVCHDSRRQTRGLDGALAGANEAKAAMAMLAAMSGTPWRSKMLGLR